MTTIENEDKQVLRQTRKGDSTLSLSNRRNIVDADSIVIDDADPENLEYLVIDAIKGTPNENDPALVTVTHPIAKTHYVGAVARRVEYQALGSDKQFARDARSGDVCVFLDDSAGLDLNSVAEIQDGAYPMEYHRINHFSVTSDAEGYFRFPPISRVAQVEIEVQGVADKKLLTLDYSQRENRFDIVI